MRIVWSKNRTFYKHVCLHSCLLQEPGYDSFAVTKQKRNGRNITKKKNKTYNGRVTTLLIW